MPHTVSTRTQWRGTNRGRRWPEKEQFSRERAQCMHKKKNLNVSLRPRCLRAGGPSANRQAVGEPFPGSIVSDYAKAVLELAPKGTIHTRLFSLDVVSLTDCVQQLFSGGSRWIGSWMLDAGCSA